MNYDYDKNGQVYMVDISEWKTSDSELADDMFLYVPDQCRNNDCRVHIQWHGCAMSAVENNM